MTRPKGSVAGLDHYGESGSHRPTWRTLTKGRMGQVVSRTKWWACCKAPSRPLARMGAQCTEFPHPSSFAPAPGWFSPMPSCVSVDVCIMFRENSSGPWARGTDSQSWHLSPQLLRDLRNSWWDHCPCHLEVVLFLDSSTFWTCEPNDDGDESRCSTPVATCHFLLGRWMDHRGSYPRMVDGDFENALLQ